MGTSKTVYTTGEVAKICNVAPRTVSKWFDAGRLRGYRIPGSKDRRIPADQLIRFLRAHGMPLGDLETGRKRILVIDADTSLTAALQRTLTGQGYEVGLATTALEAGAAAHELHPHVVVVDVTLSDLPPEALVRFFRSLPAAAVPRLIGMGSGLSEARRQGLLQMGFDATLRKPFDSQTLLDAIDVRTRAPAVPQLV